MTEVFSTYVSAESLSWGIIISGLIFVCFWYLDHQTHIKIWQQDITDKELRTHRMILYSSWVLQGSLVAMYWNPILALPVFIGAFITRFTHEFIDEIKFHCDRCDERETIIHLIMWISVYTGTAFMFIWGFFYQYKGLFELPLYHWVLLLIVMVGTSIIGNRELKSYKE